MKYFQKIFKKCFRTQLKSNSPPSWTAILRLQLLLLLVLNAHHWYWSPITDIMLLLLTLLQPYDIIETVFRTVFDSYYLNRAHVFIHKFLDTPSLSISENSIQLYFPKILWPVISFEKTNMNFCKYFWKWSILNYFIFWKLNILFEIII